MKKITTDEFINRSRVIHGNKYDYSLVKYNGIKNKVEIICKIHGIFLQIPDKHMRGANCKKCSIVSNSIKRKLSTDKFIEQSIGVHGDTYDYSMTNYTASRNRVVIICKIHGKFKQNANNHLSGKGCLKCANEQKGWTHRKWAKAGVISKNFDSYKIYVIECRGNNESFIKVGKTFIAMHKRFHSNRCMPYKYETIFKIDGGAKYISELEIKIHRELEREGLKYSPDLVFCGDTECFKCSSIDIIKHIWRNYEYK